MLQLAITEQNTMYTRGELYYKTQYIGDVAFITEHRPKAGEYLVKYKTKRMDKVELHGDVCLSTTDLLTGNCGVVGTSIGFKQGHVVAIYPEGVAKRWHSLDNSRAGDETLLLVFDLRRALI